MLFVQGAKSKVRLRGAHAGLLVLVCQPLAMNIRRWVRNDYELVHWPPNAEKDKADGIVTAGDEQTDEGDVPHAEVSFPLPCINYLSSCFVITVGCTAAEQHADPLTCTLHCCGDAKLAVLSYGYVAIELRSIILLEQRKVFFQVTASIRWSSALRFSNQLRPTHVGFRIVSMQSRGPLRASAACGADDGRAVQSHGSRHFHRRWRPRVDHDVGHAASRTPANR